MENPQIMKRLETSNGLYENLPNDLLLEKVVRLLVLADFLENIPIVSVLHHNAVSFQ